MTPRIAAAWHLERPRTGRAAGWRLRARGSVHAFGYSSVFGGPDVAVPQLLERLADAGPLSLVGHSTGGLLALEALRRNPQLPVQRVVCWAHRCAAVAPRARCPIMVGAALGRSSELLLDGLPDWQGKAEVGLIAGSVPHGLGSLLGAMDDASDGTVALAETRLPGLTDHCVVRTSHSGLVVSPDAARQTAHFLRHGQFDHSRDAAAA